MTYTKKTILFAMFLPQMVTNILKNGQTGFLSVYTKQLFKK